jgi:branched-chain amino acid transport system ATP-binding protein
MLLEVRNLTACYGAIRAINEVSFTVDKGAIVSIIGANGAGKSTIINTISGLVKPASGSILFNGAPIHAIPPHKIVKMGIVQVPEGRGIFGNLTLKENLDVAASTRHDINQLHHDISHIFDIFPRLKERLHQQAGTLSGGEQQMLSVARALITRGQLLMLDEPSMGLAPALVEEIFRIIKRINEEGTTILLVEQNAYKAMSIAHTAYVLETGSIVLSGSAQELQHDPKVKQAYLGG